MTLEKTICQIELCKVFRKKPFVHSLYNLLYTSKNKTINLSTNYEALILTGDQEDHYVQALLSKPSHVLYALKCMHITSPPTRT